MTGQHSHKGDRPGVDTAGRCRCGKVRFFSRADARKVARSRGMRRVNAYQCDDGYWHLGHLPSVVKRGRVGREDLRSGVAS